MGSDQKTPERAAGVQKTITTRQFIDRTLNPPMYRDEELPTTILLGPRTRRFLAATIGTVETTHQSSGSLYEFSPGTFGFRVTRVSLAFGTAGERWYIRHSRIGTVDVQTPTGPSRSIAGGNYGQVSLGNGNPLTPVYVLPAGTISWAFAGSRSAKAIGAQILEAVPITRRPDEI